MSKRASMSSVPSIQQATRPQDTDLVETGRCSDTCFTASMLTGRGRCQKFFQLVWATMIPAFALAIYSTADFVQSINDYQSRQRDLRPTSGDIETAAACIRTIRSVQSLRLLTTMYLGSGDVDSGGVSWDTSDEALIIEDYIRSSFGDALKVIDASRKMAASQSATCNFASVIRAFDGEVSTPLRVLFAIGDSTVSSQSAGDASETAYCTTFDYVAARIITLKNLTLSSAFAGRNDSVSATDGVASFRSMTNLVDLLHHDCLERLVVYSGRRSDTLSLFQIWISLVELEEAYSALDLLGALHFLAAESGRNAVQLRSLAISYDRLAVDAYRQIHVVGGINIPDLPVDEVRSTIAAFVDDKVLSSTQTALLTPKFARQQSLIIARWISQLQDALESLAQTTDGILTTIDRQATEERQVISRSIGLDVFVWILVFAFLGPLVTVNAERNMEAVKAYTNSFESKEHELKMEKRKTEALLNEMLPRTVRLKLQRGEITLSAEQYDSSTVYFSDVSDFAEISDTHNPMQIVIILNEIYSFMDERIPRFDVYKVETISSVYMVASGVPTRNGNRHVTEIARMSLDVMRAAAKFRIDGMPKVSLNLRIGMHTGPVVAGVVGNKMPRYCLFGDTVNTASRMQSNGLPHRIQVSEATYLALRGNTEFVLKSRGTITIKGKGSMHTYWLMDGASTNNAEDAS